jgi:hypothetical protein
MRIKANPGHKVAIFNRDEEDRLVCDRRQYLTSEGLYDGRLNAVTQPHADVSPCDYYDRCLREGAIQLAEPERRPARPASTGKEA